MEHHLTEMENRNSSAHEATELMLRKWARGDTQGLLTSVFKEWRTLKETISAKSARRQAIEGMMIRATEGAAVAAAKSALAAWHQVTQEDIVGSHKRLIEGLQAQVDFMSSRSKQTMERYILNMAGKDGPLIKATVWASWR